MSDLPEFDAPMPPPSPAQGQGGNRVQGRAAPYLEGLNEAQRQAVEALEGAALVLAGAGTGKTRVLTTRLAHILATGRAMPSQILAVTFTNKAAAEMKGRVEKLLNYPAESMWLGTFHSLCVRILRRHAELVGLKSNFTILDTDDQIRLIKQLMEAENIDPKRWPPRGLLAVIERWKDRGLTPDKVGAGEVCEYAAGRSLELYQAYQSRLSTLNATDFGDLILHCLTLFTRNEDVLADYQRRFKYILVDEYQDTNVAQYLWLRLLARKRADKSANICCVGDEDQSIFGWRGAEIGNILKFEKDFPGATVVRLEQNYRSTPHILAAASGLIGNNEDRLGKTLWTAQEEGEKISLRGVWDGEEEARMVGDHIEDQQRKGKALKDMAILVRAGRQTREFEERFITLGLPYRVVGGPRFYERREIRDAIAYFRVVVQGEDDLAFGRIINLPKRGLGDATLKILHAASRFENIALTRAAEKLVETDELSKRARGSLSNLMADIARWRSNLSTLPHGELAGMMLDESGYTDMWRQDKSPDAPGRLENLKELISAIEEFENLSGFLEHVSLVMENTKDAGADQVSIMTLHSAKGLEFDTVFLPGWEEEMFPHQRALDESGLKGLEEERRLAYVGLTRARRKAVISFAANRRVYNQWLSALPSRFIDELPEGHVEMEQAPGLYRGVHGGAMEGGDLSEDSFGFAAAPFPSGHSPGHSSGPARGRRKSPPLIEGQAYRVTQRDAPSKGDFSAGQEVFHQKFGYGRISRVEGDKLEIAFDTGVKKVLSSFVEPVGKA